MKDIRTQQLLEVTTMMKPTLALSFGYKTQPLSSYVGSNMSNLECKVAY